MNPASSLLLVRVVEKQPDKVTNYFKGPNNTPIPREHRVTPKTGGGGSSRPCYA
jgi:hypothetical protein